MASNDQLSSIQHIVILILENRSFDHMLGFLYVDRGNQSLGGEPFEGLTGPESNSDSTGKAVPVFRITPSDKYAYCQLFGNTSAPTPAVATHQGFLQDFAYTLGWQAKGKGWSILPGTTASNIMGIFTPEMLPVLSGLAPQL